MTVNITLDLHVVGPRKKIKSRSNIYLAVNLASGLSTEPVDPDVWARHLLPWNLLQDPRGFSLFTRIGDHPWQLRESFSPEPAGRSTMVNVARDAIENRAQELVKSKRLSFAWNEVSGGDLEDDAGNLLPIPWAAFSNLISSQPADLAMQMKARWLVDIAQSYVSLWTDYNNRTFDQFALLPNEFQLDGVSMPLNIEQFPYAPETVTATYGAAEISATCTVLPATELFDPVDMTLQDYWLWVTAPDDQNLRRATLVKDGHQSEGIDLTISLLAPVKPGSVRGPLNQPTPIKRSVLSEISRAVLLARRTGPTGDISVVPWQVVTAGVPVADPTDLFETDPWDADAIRTGRLTIHDRIVVPGLIFPDYHDEKSESIPSLADVQSATDPIVAIGTTYRGTLLTGLEALSHLHDFQAISIDGGIEDDPSSIVHYPSPAPIAPSPLNSQNVKAVALCYGDRYEFVAGGIDKAGGLPMGLGEPDAPHRFSVAAGLAPPPQPLEVHFLRRKAVGDLNLLPSEPTLGWPAIPTGVALRVAEWYEHMFPDENLPPALLFTPPGNRFSAYERAGYDFTFEAPCVDEHTLERWCTPSGDDLRPAALQKMADLGAELELIAEIRDNNQEDEVTGAPLPHDPAVWGVRFTLDTFDATGTVVTQTRDLAFELAAPAISKFRYKPLLVNIDRNHVTLEVNHNSVEIPAPPEGHYSVVRSALLLQPDSYRRFALEAFYDKHNGAVDDLELIGGFYELPSQSILLETATRRLPSSDILHKSLKLARANNDDILVSVEGLSEEVAYVDAFEIDRKRWIWRNLPWFDGKGSTEPHKRRALASGLPWGLTNVPPESPGPDLDVLMAFDALQSDLHGFAVRSSTKGNWPRANGKSLSTAPLSVDDRDGMTAADYLTYGLTVTSRYSALDRDGISSGTAGKRTRQAVEFRGKTEPRVPKILSILPLTENPGTFDAEVNPDVTPLLVVLDEVWFREYGQGESLVAELVLNLTNEDAASDALLALRSGGLPNKYPPPASSAPRWTPSEADNNPALRLICRGPFGFTLDRSGNDALANATAFLVYLPKEIKKDGEVLEIGPHWSVGIQFRRELLGLSTGGTVQPKLSKPSSTYLTYTLPTISNLVAGADTGSLTLKKRAGKIEATLNDMTVLLAPYKDFRPAYLKQCRYVLLTGFAYEETGHAVRAFLPENIYWLKPGKTTVEIEKGTAIQTGSTSLRGQIWELEIFGDPPKPDSLKDMIKTLLVPGSDEAGGGKDVWARISRASSDFMIRTQL